MRAKAAFVCSLLASLGFAPAAEANGRFPRAQRLLELDGDPARLALAATYGLLVTADRGGDWKHVCELGFAFSVNEFDPIVDVSEGALLLKAARSLNRAEAPYCDFRAVLAETGSEIVTDFSVDRGVPGRVLALVIGQSGGGEAETRIDESLDAGRSFRRLGAPVPKDVALPLTLDVAAQNPELVYVSGTGPGEPGVLARSDDGARTFRTFPIPVRPGESPYLAALVPSDAERLYVRTDLWAPNAEGIYEADDALLFSDDGGESFRELVRMPAKLLGFALSPDESEVLIAYGDPADPARAVDPSVLGIYRADTADHEFSRVFSGSVTCLAWTATGVYACTSPLETGFALGFAPDSGWDAESAFPFEPLLDLTRVSGPLPCPACSSVAACEAEWPQNCSVFDACGNASSGGGSSRTCSSGGAAGESAAGATGGSGALAGGPNPGGAGRSDAGCGCRSAGARSELSPWLALALLPVALRRRRVVRLRAALCGAGAALLGCGHPAGSEDPPRSLCEGRGEPLAAGSSKQSADGSLSAELVAAAPLPPETGENSWSVRLSDAGGAPVASATVVLRALMVDHDHASPSQLGIETAPGLYDISPLVLTMPGFWTLTLGVTPEDTARAEERTVEFGVCVER